MSADTVYVVTEMTGMDCPDDVVCVAASMDEAVAMIPSRRREDFTIHPVPFHGASR